MGCNPECYTKGRGCLVSNTGKCALLYDEKDIPKGFKTFRDAFNSMVNEDKPREIKTKINRKIAP